MKDVPFVPAIYLISLIELMQEERMPVSHILDECGIHSELINKHHIYVSYNQIYSVVAAYCDLTASSNPGVNYGLRLELLTHGVLGYAYVFKGSSYDLIRNIVGYMNVRVPLLQMTVHEADDSFSVRIHCQSLPKESRRFVLQTFIASFYRLGSLLASNIEIHTREQLFTEDQALNQLLPTRIVSGSAYNELRYHTKEAAPTPGASLAKKGDSRRETPNFVLKLRQYLLKHCELLPSVKQAAEHLNMSERTLRRKLSGYGLSYRALRLDVSMNTALRYLQNTNLSIERIASKCGYSDQASFTHAFQRWQGSTPDSERRKAKRQRKVTLATSSPSED